MAEREAHGGLAYAYIDMHTCDVSIEFDPAKDRENVRRHGLSLADAEGVLRDPRVLTREDPDAQGEQRWVSLGDDGLGRILVVVYTLRRDLVRLISARRASRNERAAYEK
jgi:hypothetical protein